MKFWLYWEVNFDFLEQYQKIEQKMSEERRNEKKYGKTLASHTLETGKGVNIVDFDNVKQMANRMALNGPYIKTKLVPLIEQTLANESRSEIGKLRASW